MERWLLPQGALSTEELDPFEYVCLAGHYVATGGWQASLACRHQTSIVCQSVDSIHCRHPPYPMPLLHQRCRKPAQELQLIVPMSRCSTRCRMIANEGNVIHAQYSSTEKSISILHLRGDATEP